MSLISNKHKSYGALTKLTLNVSYTACLFTLLFAIFSFFYLKNTGVVFKLSIAFFTINLANTLLFYIHNKLVVTYNILSILGFAVSFTLCLYTGGINSSFTFFLVTIVFSGFLTNPFYGKLWSVITGIAIGVLYTLNYLGIEFTNYLPFDFIAEFNLFYIIFLMILYGGIFGRITTKNRESFRKSKNIIKHQNKEKTVMLKEIHHRVKNNLQVINSLLHIQSRNIKDPETKMVFKSAQNRIVVMGGLHEKIYKTETLKHIDVKEHFEQLIKDLIDSYHIESKITPILKIDIEKMSIETLLPLCLIINELISNSLKHAFKNRINGEIQIELKRQENNRYELLVKDNGIGYSQPVNEKAIQSTGLLLTHTFVKQLNGNIIQLETENGTAYQITFSEI